MKEVRHDVHVAAQSEGHLRKKQRLRIVTFPVLEQWQQKIISMKLKKNTHQKQKDIAGVNNHMETTSKVVKS